ncbi:hypothetical protein DFH06DRAFT_1467222 [Mycena polygramma]|nr:hypothetical protein DFH06DRAFT_1467222 [Mycena polygramma]
MSVATLPRFNDLVADTIAAHSHVAAEQIIVLDNSDKYTPDGINPQHATSGHDTLSQIFDTMAKVNRMALESDTLCAGSHGGASFRDALLEASSQVAQLANGRRVRYVELGPEPWKSRAILEHLLAAGVRLASYVGIDINPASEATMRDALVPTVGAERFHYLIADFYKCSVDDIPAPPSTPDADDGYATVVTNLGFQEGNDLPERIGPMLSCLTRPGDFVLSEMQVFLPLGSSAVECIIKDFYHHPEMRRFSGLVGRQFDPACSLVPSEGDETEYLFYLLPMQTGIGAVKVATTLISARVDGTKRYVLTNSCLKYTSEQFDMARQAMGKFIVRKVLETGDKSVVFHIAERL